MGADGREQIAKIGEGLDAQALAACDQSTQHSSGSDLCRSRRTASCVGRQPSKVHSAHIGREIEVHYRWHPFYGRRLLVEYIAQRAGGSIVQVEIEPGVVTILPEWPSQVLTNLESQRRQYDLSEVARRHGFANIEVIDDDLGRSASGTVARPGFDRLVAAVCAGEVGAVLCLEASRLARNGRDWHHLLELCGLVGARVIDTDGVYDPCRRNDRLLPGMKGSISEFKLGVIRARMLDAARAKARRGELRICVPIGYIWHPEMGVYARRTIIKSLSVNGKFSSRITTRAISSGASSSVINRRHVEPHGYADRPRQELDRQPCRLFASCAGNP